jgi:hypothetical protein
MKTKITAAPAPTTRKAASSGMEQVMTVSFMMLGATAAALGSWAFLSLLGALVNSGGPVALAIQFVKTTFGIA